MPRRIKNPFHSIYHKPGHHGTAAPTFTSRMWVASHPHRAKLSPVSSQRSYILTTKSYICSRNHSKMISDDWRGERSWATFGSRRFVQLSTVHARKRRSPRKLFHSIFYVSVQRFASESADQKSSTSITFPQPEKINLTLNLSF